MTPDGVTLQHPDCVWIGGAWHRPHSGRSIEIVSPNSESVVAVVAEADEADMDAAVAAARATFDDGPWPFLPLAERLAYLKAIPCEDEADAIRIANNSSYGLAGSVLTNDAEAAYRIARRVRTGGVRRTGCGSISGCRSGGSSNRGSVAKAGSRGCGRVSRPRRSCSMPCQKNLGRRNSR